MTAYTNPDLIHSLNTAAGRRVDKRSEVKVSSCKEKERQAEPLVRERKTGKLADRERMCSFMAMAISSGLRVEKGQHWSNMRRRG